jgi:regulator of protease activity HflC (stomatin/prohibitin superfamily)
MVREIEFRPRSGWRVLTMLLIAGASGITLLIQGAILQSALLVLSTMALLVITLVMTAGFMAVAPNNARVLLLFGEYHGSVKTSGFYWVNPFYSKKKVSLRVRNFETGSHQTPEEKNTSGTVVRAKGRSASRPSKVNDRDGNPIEISAVVVWRVVETAEALLEVDDYEDYVAIQSEAALRGLSTRHPYDSEDHEISLRGNTADISDQLRQDIQERLNQAGVHVIEARISHLAYAPEIAAAMLQRQQAAAVVAARARIVDGAVGMVQMALAHLERDGVVELDNERRAAMVSNLLVVLCSDRHTQPVVNAGSLYQ